MLSLVLAVLTQSPLSISQVLAPFWVPLVSVDTSSSVPDTPPFLVLVSSQHNSSDTFSFVVSDDIAGSESFEMAAEAFDVAFELQLTGSLILASAAEGRCDTSFVALAATESEFQKSELSFKDESSNNGTVSEEVVKEFLLDVSTESN